MNLDQIIVDFVSKNYLTLTITFTALKGLAKITPWAWDDSVISLFAGIIPALRKGQEK